MNEVTLLLFYIASTHVLVEYAGLWRTVRSDLTWTSYAWRACLFLGLSLIWLIPWLSVGGVFVLLALGALRETLRWQLSTRHRRLASRPLLAPVVEMAGHLFLIFGWLWAHQLTATTQPVRLDAWAACVASPRTVEAVAFLAGLAFAIGGGTVFIRGLLAQAGKSPSEGDSKKHPTQEEYGVGRIIGDLERTLIFLMALQGQLEAAGLVLAAKSIARFKEFDKQEFAEYYLLGTLSSTLWAILVAKAVLWVTSFI